MTIEGKKILLRFLDKNRGNKRLITAIEQLISDLENTEIRSAEDLYKVRRDADKVHNDGFYFFDIHVHRIMMLVKFHSNRAIVIWAGNHDNYAATFKNNKTSIEKWLRTNGHIH